VTGPSASVFLVNYSHLSELAGKVSQAASQVRFEPALRDPGSSVIQSAAVSEAMSFGISEQNERATVTATTLDGVGTTMKQIVVALKTADAGLASSAVTQ